MIYSGDFETTVDPKKVRVWCWGLTEVISKKFECGTNLDDFFTFFRKPENNVVYFHNLPFDGSYILYWLFINGYTHSTNRHPKANEFTSMISDTGVFYSVTITTYSTPTRTYTIKLVDSANILRSSIKKIAEDYKLPVKKGSIDYEAYRPIGYIPTQDEWEYVQNDTLIAAFALEDVIQYNRLTIGGIAFKIYKDGIGKNEFEKLFPVLEEAVDTFIRASLKGGFTYLNPKYSGKIIRTPVRCFDVVSLYPWVLYTQLLPYGNPVKFTGKYDKKFGNIYPLWVQKISFRFKLKTNHIPCIQIKKNYRFVETEYLNTSGVEGVVLTLTSIDWQLIQEQYNVYDVEYLDGYMLKAKTGMFKDFIERFFAQKNEANKTGNASAKMFAKYMLNNLWGKFSTNPVVKSKIPYFDGEADIVRFKKGEEQKTKGVYIPVGVFTTAYARYKTITTAQKLYPYHIYSDTDSNHFTGVELEDIKKVIDIGEDIGQWEYEKYSIKSKYLRQKTYMLHCCKPNTDNYTTLIKCASMPDSIHHEVNFDNFSVGFKAKTLRLQRKMVSGGVYLKPTQFSIK